MTTAYLALAFYTLLVICQAENSGTLVAIFGIHTACFSSAELQNPGHGLMEASLYLPASSSSSIDFKYSESRYCMIDSQSEKNVYLYVRVSLGTILK
jgi:hypothetical protein